MEATAGEAVVTAFCTLRIRAFVTALDPDSMWIDPDTRDMHSVWRLRGNIEQEMERNVAVSVTYDVKHPENVKIDEVEFKHRPLK